ncbi:MAG: Gfo/Idh/MocA family oxidoreductase [Actinobacteria bacterium]|nr:Gfo/Idh/MocA family oxidoreductase [Actinomycetota bacterium]
MTIRVGLIGAGNIGTSHARDLAFAVSGAAVSAVFDADAERAHDLASEVGAIPFARADDLIGSPDVDAVLIASPDDAHAEQALACLAAGKPTLCEKPLAPEESDALRVVEAEVAGGRRLIMMGFMRRFDPGYSSLKAELGASGIGEPLIVNNIHRNMSAPYGLASERTLTNMVIHEFDINRWLLDEEYASVQVLTGRSGPYTPDGERDPLLVILQTTSGVLVEIEAFVNARYGYEVICRVTGSEGSAVMGDGSYVTRSARGHRGQAVPELWLGRFADAYRLQLQSWIDQLSGRGRPAGASAWDGYVATIVANRAIQALRSGVRIGVDLPERPPLYT